MSICEMSRWPPRRFAGISRPRSLIAARGSCSCATAVVSARCRAERACVIPGDRTAARAVLLRDCGKPEIVGEPILTFSVLHSSERVVIAVGSGGPVGVDLERIRAITDLPGLLRVFCSTAEAAAIMAQPPELRLHTFFRCWARRESYVKAVGTGLSRSTPERRCRNRPTASSVPMGLPARIRGSSTMSGARRIW